MKVYINYIKAFGVLLFIALIFFNLMIHLNSILSSFWLTQWTENPYMLNVSNINTSHYEELTNMYLGVYGCFGLGVGKSNYNHTIFHQFVSFVLFSVFLSSLLQLC